jgi:hypothetical protein
MAQIDWSAIMNGDQGRPKRRYAGANVKFFYAYNENRQKSLEAGRPIYDEIPSISIQWPGMDTTVRKIEPQDIQEYPEMYAAFKAGSEPVEGGTPLTEWALLPGSVCRELQYMGFKTVEQLADASDDIRRKLGPSGRYIKMAKDWMDSAKSSQADVVALKEELDNEKRRTEKLREQVELLLQRVEANEGTDLRSHRKEVIQSIEVDSVEELKPGFDEVEVPKRRGRPRKV